MRIPSGKIDQVIYFVAVDSIDLTTRKTGLTSFTVYRSRNGGAAAVYTTPTITELSAANMPGVYSLLMDEDTTIASTSDAEEYCVHITQASMAPVNRVIELFRRDTTTGRTATVDANGRVDVSAIQGTSQTARDIGASVLLSSGTGTGQVSLTAGVVSANATQISGAAVNTASAQLGVNVVNAGGTAWNSGAITANTFAAGAITAAKFAANALDAVWSNATRVLTAGTNIVLAKGTGITGFNDLDASGVRGAVGMAAANLDTQLAALSGNHTTINANILAVDTKLGAPAGASVSADIAAVKADTGAIKPKTDNLPAAPAAVSDVPTANANADALLDKAAGIEGGLTVRQGLRLFASALLGKANGLGTTIAKFRDTNDTKDRITATVDAAGNRSSVTLDAS
ncbi:hypothetical protein EOA46_08445 [Mesorhizobium sp. M1A.F.Ca.IN.022.05.2.1]|uniref:hypothetical protein n=3 Tax=Mesorhizobium TaxID=68287 RepID=UPI000FCB7269|nr:MULTISPECIES: hypothetical protein [unclassified Mesorhizobium]RUV90253.1 hypothetical protein EOA51_00610 [Mesorhizobium sp. M1A.F.Ca.IN.020.32.1.1]RUW12728.1 hypothetical protein EOA46_08445 [Mesorhizobium sp. M1A.F.Ca.IN.022.05.2.1]RWG04191.1 MAG: hypothetical protein EOQ38_06530 [Mesorhizobium sp.]RWG91974.1 MAG: hypothetical protein EOQ68_04605 [Mesorhizobium sp.]RWH06949.1 MAG: hypothetical protein EOQ73_03230 [Mesorhizobium sp.]